MNYLLFQGIITLWICLSTVGSTRHGYPYPPAAPIPDGPNTPPLTGPGPGPTGLTGPSGPTGPFGPTALGPGPGPFGPGPFPGPFPGPIPYGPLPYPFPPPYPPFFHPYGGHGHHGCHPLGLLRKFVPKFVEPIITSSVSMFIVNLIKKVVLPYFGIFAHRMGRVLDDADPVALDRLSRSIKQAITKGACLERIACNVGRRASDYSISPSILRMIKSNENPNSLLEIFRLSASGEVSSCKKYTCWYNASVLSEDLTTQNREMKFTITNDT